ncbi:hypothetical protein LTR46_004892 [Exophiala xenobiotica]|nr:hypothetical protein LTR18_004288 [Exophiala xenobiotica]KAK5557081.1 hypothetical protein LTR46_004892 [Exophiala xenobiotica]
MDFDPSSLKPSQEAHVQQLLLGLRNEEQTGVLDDLERRQITDPATGETHTGLTPKSLPLWVAKLAELKEENHRYLELKAQQDVVACAIQSWEADLALKKFQLEEQHEVLHHETLRKKKTESEQELFNEVKSIIIDYPHWHSELQDIGLFPNPEEVIEKALGGFEALRARFHELSSEPEVLRTQIESVAQNYAKLHSDSNAEHEKKFKALLIVYDAYYKTQEDLKSSQSRCQELGESVAALEKKLERLQNELAGLRLANEENPRQKQSVDENAKLEAEQYHKLLLVAIGRHPEDKTLNDAFCEARIVSRQMVQAQETPSRPRLSFIHGLTASLQTGDSALQTALKIFLQTPSNPTKISVSSIQDLATKLEGCERGCLAECISYLSASVCMLGRKSELSYNGSVILLQLFELLCSSAQHLPAVLDRIAGAFSLYRPRLWSQDVLVPAMTELVERLLHQERPELGDLIVSRARDNDQLAHVENFNVTMEGPNLLAVSVYMVLEDAPLMGSGELLVASGKPQSMEETKAMRLFSASLTRKGPPYSAQDRSEVELIDE